MAIQKIIPKFVLSTKTFESLEGARKQLQKWRDENNLTPGTRVFKIIEFYDIKEVPATIKLVKGKSYVK